MTKGTVRRRLRPALDEMDAMVSRAERKGLTSLPAGQEQRFERLLSLVGALSWQMDMAGAVRERREATRPRLTRWKQSLRPLLLHEAGHGVLGSVVGLRVTQIQIDYRGDKPSGSGRVLFREPNSQHPAIVALAGPVAEDFGSGRRALSALRLQQLVEAGELRGDRDWSDAVWAVNRSSGDGRAGTPRTIEEAYAETCATLRECWPACEAVADELAQSRGSVSGIVVRELCKKHGARWMPAQR